MKKSLIFLLVLLFCFTLSCQQKPEVGLTEEAAKSLVDRYLEIWNEGNLDIVEELMDSECIIHHPAYPEGIVGHEDFKNWVTVNRTAFPDFKGTTEDMIFKGDKIIGHWIVTGTNTGPFGEFPPTGKQVRFSGVDIHHIVNGKVKEVWSFLDLLGLYQQLGFTLTAPAPPESPEKK